MTLFFLLLFLVVQPIYSAESTQSVRINEVLIEPQQQVELVNTGDVTIDISNWYLDDDGGTTYYTIPAGTTVLPDHCVVISGNLNLNKASKDTIRLFSDGANPLDLHALIIDSYTFDKSYGQAISFQRIPDLSENWATASATLGSWNDGRGVCTAVPTETPTPTTSKTPSPTPTTKQTPTHTPSPTPAQIISNVYISEFYAAPKSGDSEWVELYNNNEHQITLTNWYIDDKEDYGATPKKFSLTIPAYEYRVIHLTSAILNNSGDSVRLLDQAQREIEIHTYENAEAGNSIGWDTVLSAHYCVQIPTPGEKNKGCSEDNSTEESMIGEIQGATSQPFITISKPLNLRSRSRYEIEASVPEISDKKGFPSNSGDNLAKGSDSLEQAKSARISPLSSLALLSICSIAAKIKLYI